MPFYHKSGELPRKRHTQFRNASGDLYHEELVSTEGFSDIYSLVYHLYPPTIVKKINPHFSVKPNISVADNMQHRSLKGFQISPEDDFLKSRKPVLVNHDVEIILSAPKKSMDYFYKNATCDEMIFVHVGSGTLKTAFGNIKFGYGDYLVIPRGVIYQLDFDTEDNRLFIVTSTTPYQFPRRYRNDYGQLMEHAPFYERDLRLPENMKTHDEKGDFLVYIHKFGNMYPYTYGTHPFDLIGWDGFFYPYAFSIHDFEPITGRLHMPPPIHQTFETKSFVVCSFVPRLYDYHPLSIPAPYHHSNVDSDEVLYYVDGEFMSRKNVEKGQITLHPIGIPHGPHPGTIERSIGQKETLELAVMVDTFKPLFLTDWAMGIEDKDYFLSWLH